MSADEEPVPERAGDSWTCPPGYAFPYCGGCGHIYFQLKPQRLVDGTAPTAGLCQWCIAERVAEMVQDEDQE